ncbi:PAS domain S-box protein, partial [Candidatus Poribacteria bacterium]|nr:PAS domain S-box protein [Candidatus Poribacteria bacterium]
MTRRLRSDLMYVLTLAALYYLAGRLSLLLSIRGGPAAPVWPAAGIALAFVLARGYRMGAGVFLGALPTNLYSTLAAGSGEISLTAGILATNSACGATLQALAGAYLVRRLVGFPRALEDEGAAALFVVIAGPIACCVSPTLGVSGLVLSGAVPLAVYGMTWWTWWVGDSIGALVFAPLTLVWLPGARGMVTRRRLAVSAPLCLLFGVTVFLFFRAGAWEADRAQARFERQAQEMGDRVAETVTSYTQITKAIAGLMEVAPDASREEFGHFAARFLHPGVQALSWAPRVSHADRAGYEARARADGLAQFAFTQRDGNGLVPAAPRDEYVPVYLIEPFAGNEAAVGFDLASNAARKAALERAAATGAATGTEPITLVQETGSQQGYLVLAPAYDATPGASAAAPALLGYASGVFRAGDIVSAALAATQSAEIGLSIVDRTNAAAPVPLYGPENADGASTPPDPYGLVHTRHLHVGGRTWTLRVTPTERFGKSLSRWQAWGVLTAGLLFTGFVGMTLLVMTGRTGRMEQLVDERTGELARAHSDVQERSSRLEAVHDAAADGILSVDADARIESANPAAAQVFHAAGDELVGEDISRFLTRDDLPTVLERVAAIVEGHSEAEGTERRQVTGRRADGKPFPLELSMTPLDIGGPRMALLVVRDVSERHELDRIKDEFVSTVSHELRTPVSAIKGAVDLVAGGMAGDVSAEAQSMVDIASRNADRMLHLVDDILA